MSSQAPNRSRPHSAVAVCAVPWRGRRAVQGTHAPGVTLTELAMILVLVGVIAAMASPYLLEARAAYRFDNGAREVLRGLQRARFEAVRRNAPVAFTRIDDTRFEVEGVGQFTIPAGVRFVSGPVTVQFASFGPVIGGAEPFVLSDGMRTKQVVINLSGYASLE